MNAFILYFYVRKKNLHLILITCILWQCSRAMLQIEHRIVCTLRSFQGLGGFCYKKENKSYFNVNSNILLKEILIARIRHKFHSQANQRLNLIQKTF